MKDKKQGVANYISLLLIKRGNHMKWNMLWWCLFFLLYESNIFCLINHTKVHDIINRYYTNVTGFGICSQDEKNILNCGGAPTYGEMTFDGVHKLVDYLKPTKDDVFVDAGCGVGKLVTQVFFETDVAKSIGIELSQGRYDKAMQVKAALSKDNQLPKGRTLDFYHANIIDAIPQDTTLFFMCSTCFSNDLMKKIMEKLRLLKQGLRVITLKPLLESKEFVLQKKLELPMTWSPSTSVHIYILEKK